MFRVFIDEVGHHDLKSSDDPNERYLGLTGVIMRLAYESGEFARALSDLKQQVFGRTEIVLHRRHILLGIQPFDALQNREVKERFGRLLLELLTTASYRVFTVVIDKQEHKRKYAVWRFHPYHYCLTVLLERYVMWLGRVRQVGDVLVESRGKKENMQLERAYQYVFRCGTDYVNAKAFQDRLTSREIKIQPKTANVAGLQLADLLANPTCRGLICEKTKTEMTATFSKKILEVLKKNKYLKNPNDGTIPGWGTKWLP